VKSIVNFFRHLFEVATFVLTIYVIGYLITYKHNHEKNYVIYSDNGKNVETENAICQNGYLFANNYSQVLNDEGKGIRCSEHKIVYENNSTILNWWAQGGLK
jgi:hypothetical protein